MKIVTHGVRGKAGRGVRDKNEISDYTFLSGLNFWTMYKLQITHVIFTYFKNKI